METSKITVNAEWDAEANVWVSTSDDVPGLITEAATVEALAEKLSVIIPELLGSGLGSGLNLDLFNFRLALTHSQTHPLTLGLFNQRYGETYGSIRWL